MGTCVGYIEQIGDFPVQLHRENTFLPQVVNEQCRGPSTAYHLSLVKDDASLRMTGVSSEMRFHCVAIELDTLAIFGAAVGSSSPRKYWPLAAFISGMATYGFE